MAIDVAVVYATAKRQIWIDLKVPEGATVHQAIDQSGILERCPEIDLETQKVGVHSKIVGLDTALEDGARVEIYRPITADPETIPRRDRPPPG